MPDDAVGDAGSADGLKRGSGHDSSIWSTDGAGDQLTARQALVQGQPGADGCRPAITLLPAAPGPASRLAGPVELAGHHG